MNKIEVRKIIENGGATLNRKGEAVSFSRGYQVSKKDCYKITVENVDKIAEAIKELLNSIGKNDFVGVWVDNGAVYVDISENIKNRSKALHVGHARKQKSVFEWSTGLCVEC